MTIVPSLRRCTTSKGGPEKISGPPKARKVGSIPTPTTKMSEPPAVAGGPKVERYGPVATAPGSDKTGPSRRTDEALSYLQKGKPEVEGLNPSLGTKFDYQVIGA